MRNNFTITISKVTSYMNNNFQTKSSYTRKCHCPYSNTMKQWRQWRGLQKVRQYKEIHKCLRFKFNSTTVFLDHCNQHASYCHLHWNFIEKIELMYPNKTQRITKITKKSKYCVSTIQNIFFVF